MKARATILVKGDVQEAGYRSMVSDTAQKLRLTGFVENLHDGRVRIICEGKKEAIAELCDRIRIKDEYINVTSVRKRFGKPKGEFKVFEVRTDDLAVEMFRGYVTAGKYFRSLGNKIEGVGEKVDSVVGKVDSVGEKVDSVGVKVESVGDKVDVVGDKVDSVGEKVDSVGGKVDSVGIKVDSVGDKVESVGVKFDSVGEKVDSVNTEVRGVGKGIALMHDDMNRQFDRTDESYGEFSRKMDSLDDHIKEIRDDFKVLVEHFVGQERKVA